MEALLKDTFLVRTVSENEFSLLSLKYNYVSSSAVWGHPTKKKNTEQSVLATDTVFNKSYETGNVCELAVSYYFALQLKHWLTVCKRSHLRNRSHKQNYLKT